MQYAVVREKLYPYMSLDLSLKLITTCNGVVHHHIALDFIKHIIHIHRVQAFGFQIL